MKITITFVHYSSTFRTYALFAITPSLQMSNSYISQQLSFTQNIATISFDYKLGCSLYYYGSDCSVYCSPVNDDTGHYSCDSDGNKVCLPGYSDPNTNCLNKGSKY